MMIDRVFASRAISGQKPVQAVRHGRIKTLLCRLLTVDVIGRAGKSTAA